MAAAAAARDGELAALRDTVRRQALEITRLNAQPSPPPRPRLPALRSFCVSMGNVEDIAGLVGTLQKVAAAFAPFFDPHSALQSLCAAWSEQLEGSRAMMEAFTPVHILDAHLNGEVDPAEERLAKGKRLLETVGYALYGVLAPAYFLLTWAPKLCKRFRLDPEAVGRPLGRLWVALTGLDFLWALRAWILVARARPRVVRPPTDCRPPAPRPTDPLAAATLPLARRWVAHVLATHGADLHPLPRPLASVLPWLQLFLELFASAPG